MGKPSAIDGRLTPFILNERTSRRWEVSKLLQTDAFQHVPKLGPVRSSLLTISLQSPYPCSPKAHQSRVSGC